MRSPQAVPEHVWPLTSAVKVPTTGVPPTETSAVNVLLRRVASCVGDSTETEEKEMDSVSSCAVVAVDGW